MQLTVELPKLMSTDEVAEVYGLRRQTLDKARCTKVGPLAKLPWVQIGRKVFYKATDVARFVERHTVTLAEER